MYSLLDSDDDSLSISAALDKNGGDDEHRLAKLGAESYSQAEGCSHVPLAGICQHRGSISSSCHQCDGRSLGAANDDFNKCDESQWHEWPEANPPGARPVALIRLPPLPWNGLLRTLR